ncbi:unnamed protein product [Coffea canephora]|uniref:Protein kinase domain-containing protein n=1 Tax=Coffea canephora TaxID=49390 RepID=A0A068VFL6_COFCA|nr:unnamed protein product [Coffea canephora]
MWGFRSSSTLANIFLLLLVAMIFSISHVSTSKQFKNETDRLALLEFKKQIYDDPLGVLNSWNHSQHHCQWEGHFSGIISPHVGNLSFMRLIHLEENQFHGEIPQEFGRLFRLRVLNLSYNVLGGKMPANLSYCSELININIHDNKLEGKIPIDQLSSLKKLEYFGLRTNNLTGEIPSSIGNLSSLTGLAFDFNNLEGNLPMEMGLLKRFAGLGAAENKLSGIIPASIFNISAITVISVAGNSFHGSLPTNIGLTLPNLQVLYVGGTNLYGNFPISITNASGLEILDLPYNKFAGQIPTNLGDLTNLQRLNLDTNLFGGNSTRDLDFIASLTNCSGLRILSLGYNKFGGNIPRVMANLSNQLTKLFLGGNQLSGTIPGGFGNFVNLYLLSLEENYLSGVIPRDFGKLQNLQILRRNIFDNVLMNCQNLQYLDVSQNNFSGIISPHFLQKHSSLIYMKICENSFSGSLPLEVGKLIHLADFNVSHNQLAGGIPMSLADCSNLENLFMQSNFFRGTIPPNLASCKSIQRLDLSSNNLTGPIPKEFEKLQFLRYLNLSYNEIEGEIPNTGVFSNASQISLIGNNKLSGGIPELEFPPCPTPIPLFLLTKRITTGDFGRENLKAWAFDFGGDHGGKEKGFGPLFSRVPLSINISMLSDLIFMGLFYLLDVFLVINAIGKLIPTVVPRSTFLADDLSLYFLVYRKRERRLVAGFSSMPTRVDKLLRISYHELLRATSGFSSENLIGSGNFGSVCKGRLEKHGNMLVAVKVLDLQKNRASKSFKAECKALRNIRHRNLISIVSYCSSIDSKGDEFKALVYEFMENGNLDLWLHPSETTDQTTSSRSLNLLQKLNIAIDVASALQYLHDHCEAEIVHCDLKPSNILLDNDLDAYYGILLLEMITRRRPIDDIFMGDLDLHNYVNGALHERVLEIVDPLLLSEGRDENSRITHGEEAINGGRGIDCIISLLKIGLKCSARLPNDRMHMNEVVRKLHLIKDVFLGVKVHQENLEA